MKNNIKVRKKQKLAMGDRVFYLVTGILLTAVFLAVLYPCVFVLSASISDSAAVTGGRVFILPVGFNLEGYEAVFEDRRVWSGYINSIYYTVFGTLINIVVTFACAYPLSRRDLPGRDKLMLFFAFTMYFSGGLIGHYIWNVKYGFVNSRWSMLLPGAMSVTNMIITRTFLQQNIPEDLWDASRLDGCSDFQYLRKVVLPLSHTVLAVLVLYYGVSHWNSYFDAMIYLRKQNLQPLTIFLRQILVLEQVDMSEYSDPDLIFKVMQLAATLKYALIIVSIVPVLLMYPFVQKYFVKGVTIGAIKG